MMQLERQVKQPKAKNQPFNQEKDLFILNMKNLQFDQDIGNLEKQLSNIQRNPFITVYKDLQRIPHSYNHQMISQIVNSMADQQRIIIQKNQEKREAIKQITTTDEINSNLENSIKEIQNVLKINSLLLSNKLIQTLIKYLIEIQERQSDGQMNNALIMIQQDIVGLNAMCAATALFRRINIENSKINQSRPLKIAYINLTLNDSPNNVELWHQSTENTKNLSAYFSIFKNSNCDLRKYSRIPLLYLYPIEEPKNKFLTRMQLRTIFKNCIRSPLELFNPQIISLSISYNQENKIDLQELQNVVRKLCYMSNNKLIIHINFDQLSNTTPNAIIQEEFTQLVNCIYQGMQFIRIPKSIEIFGDPINTIEWLRKTSKYLQDYYQNHNAKVLKRYANTLELMQPQFMDENKQLTFEFQEGRFEKYIGYYLENIFILFQVREGDKQIFFNKSTQIYLNHEEKILAIYDEKNHQAYYGNLNQLKSNSEYIVKVELIQNLPNLIKPSLLIIKKYIILAYGTLQQKSNSIEEFNESIYCFHYGQKQLIEFKYQRVKGNQNPFQNLHLPSKKNQNLFDQKSTIKWVYDGEVQHKRQSPGVAKISLLKDDEKTVNFMLIGGEGIQGVNQIQNVIECISLNLEDKTYIAGIIDKVSLHRFPTFKPFAHQIILDSTKENGEKRFIILPGNLNMFSEYYKQPINQSYAERATMIKVTQKEDQQGIDISEVQIQYDSENLLNFPISMLLNNQNNFQIIRNDEDLIIWCLNSSAIAYYPKLVKQKSDIQYQHNQHMEIEQDSQNLFRVAQNLQIIDSSLANEKYDDRSQKMIPEQQCNQIYLGNSVINQSVLFNYYFIIKFELQLKTNILNIIETTVQDNQYLEIDSSQFIQNK